MPALRNDMPSIHNHIGICHAAGKRHFLLHQQHCEAHFFVESANGCGDVAHNVGLDALGWFVQNEQARLQRERPGNGKLLLLPPGKIAAPPMHHFAQHGEKVKDELRNGPGLVLAHGQGKFHVFTYGQQGEDLAALRHITDAQGRAALHRQRKQVRSFKENMTGARRQHAHDALKQGGFAHAVSSHEAGARTGLYLKVDVAQDVAFAIILIETCYMQHYAPPEHEARKLAVCSGHPAQGQPEISQRQARAVQG